MATRIVGKVGHFGVLGRSVFVPIALASGVAHRSLLGQALRAPA